MSEQDTETVVALLAATTVSALSFEIGVDYLDEVTATATAVVLQQEMNSKKCSDYLLY